MADSQSTENMAVAATPIPVHQWTHDGDRVLIVKFVNRDGTSYGGHQWPEKGKTICPKAAKDRDAANNSSCETGAGVVMPKGEWWWTDGDPHDLESCGVVGDVFRCPYGVPGDRLYVRETVCILDCRHWPYPDRPRSTVLDATKGNRNGAAYQADCDNDSERCSGELGYKWTRSIHMPRWASRIDLEVTDVRVERLRAITEDDAKAEGFSAKVHKTEGVNTARWQFRETWDTLNGKRQSGALAWQRNPWVWVIEFRKAEAHT